MAGWCVCVFKSGNVCVWQCISGCFWCVCVWVCVYLCVSGMCLCFWRVCVCICVFPAGVRLCLRVSGGCVSVSACFWRVCVFLGIDVTLPPPPSPFPLSPAPTWHSVGAPQPGVLREGWGCRAWAPVCPHLVQTSHGSCLRRRGHCCPRIRDPNALLKLVKWNQINC